MHGTEQVVIARCNKILLHEKVSHVRLAILYCCGYSNQPTKRTLPSVLNLCHSCLKRVIFSPFLKPTVVYVAHFAKERRHDKQETSKKVGTYTT